MGAFIAVIHFGNAIADLYFAALPSQTFIYLNTEGLRMLITVMGIIYLLLRSDSLPNQEREEY